MRSTSYGFILAIKLDPQTEASTNTMKRLDAVLVLQNSAMPHPAKITCRIPNADTTGIRIRSGMSSSRLRTNWLNVCIHDTRHRGILVNIPASQPLLATHLDTGVL